MTANLASPIVQGGASRERRLSQTGDERQPIPFRPRRSNATYTDHTYEVIVAVAGLLAAGAVVGGIYLVNRRLRG